MNKYIYILIFITIVGVEKVLAQTPQPAYDTLPRVIDVIGKSFGDSVIIRWAPLYPEAWLMGNKFGYDVYRFKVKESKDVLIEKPVKIKLNSQPIMPLPLETIEHNYSHDKYAAIVAQAIYGESFEMNKGNGKVSFINQALEIDNRYSFSLFACDMSVQASLSHGLALIDKDVEPQASYVYLIKPVWKDTLAMIDSALIFIHIADTSSPPKPIELSAVFSDRMVDLSWNFEIFASVFNAYNIERSDDQGKSFKKINKNPVINITQNVNQMIKRIHYIDTLPDNEKYYMYRVRGITAFGEISQPSDVIQGIGIPQEFGLNPINISSPMQDSPVIEVKWEFDMESEKRIRGFIIERGNTDKGPFSIISDTLIAGLRTFTDIKPLGSAYYQVCAISKVKGDYCSFPSLVQSPDSIPPAIPEGLKATIDSSGIVTLFWDSNLEPDMFCYSIYKANNPAGEFVKVNKIMVTDTVYSDTVTLATLTKNVYYAITALDKHYNESKRTVPIKVIRPDTICPASPTFSDYKVLSSGINLFWNSSPSNDVVKQILYRKVKNNNEWTVIAVFDSVTIAQYLDNTVKPGLVYDYLLLAVDENGLESEANNIITIKALSVISANSVNLMVEADEEQKKIIVKWKSQVSNLDEIMLYKSTDGGKYQLLAICKWTDQQFVDGKVKRGHQYNYRTQTIDLDNIKSKISEPVSINF